MKNDNFKTQNGAGIASAFEQVREQNKIKAQNRQDLLLQAKKNICKIIGEPQYIEQLKGNGYTYKDAVQYIIKKYNAKPIDFLECLDYIPNKYNLVKGCLGAKDKVSYLTDGWLTEDCLNEIFLLPALCEQTSVYATKQNGCVLLLSKQNGLLDAWWIGGNKKGYEVLYNYEMKVLEGKI